MDGDGLAVLDERELLAGGEEGATMKSIHVVEELLPLASLLPSVATYQSAAHKEFDENITVIRNAIMIDFFISIPSSGRSKFIIGRLLYKS